MASSGSSGGISADLFGHIETESYQKSKRMLAAVHPPGSTSRKNSTLNNILSSDVDNKSIPNEKPSYQSNNITLPSFSEIISPTAVAAPQAPAALSPFAVPQNMELNYPPSQFVCLSSQHSQLLSNCSTVHYPPPPTLYTAPRFHPPLYQYYVPQQPAAAPPHMNDGNSLNFLATMASADQNVRRQHPTIYPKPDQSFQFHQQKIPNSAISDQPVEYPCTHTGCRKVFPSRSRLHRHEIVHLGEKNFKCIHPGCEKRFSRKDNMLQHYRNHGVSIARESSRKGRRSKTDEP